MENRETNVEGAPSTTTQFHGAVWLENGRPREKNEWWRNKRLANEVNWYYRICVMKVRGKVSGNRRREAERNKENAETGQRGADKGVYGRNLIIFGVMEKLLAQRTIAGASNEHFHILPPLPPLTYASAPIYTLWDYEWNDCYSYNFHARFNYRFTGAPFAVTASTVQAAQSAGDRAKCGGVFPQVLKLDLATMRW